MFTSLLLNLITQKKELSGYYPALTYASPAIVQCWPFKNEKETHLEREEAIKIMISQM